MSKVKFSRMTQAAFDALAEKDADTLYFTTDTHRQFVGSKEIQPSGAVATDDVTIKIQTGETSIGVTARAAWSPPGNITRK